MTGYILKDDKNKILDAWFVTLEEAMEVSADLINAGDSTGYEIIEANTLGVIVDMPWGELKWQDA